MALSVSRRKFVSFGVSFLPVVVFESSALAQTDRFYTLMIVFKNIGAVRDPDLLRDVLMEFFNRGIPVTVTLEAASMRSGPQDNLNAMMRDLAASQGGLIELVAPVADMTGQHRYFQMRAAGALRHTITADLGAEAARQVATLVDHTQEGGVDLPAFRSAGFRILLRPEGDGDFTAEFVGRGQLVLSGGTVLPLSGDMSRVSESLEAVLSERRDGLLLLSLADLHDIDAAEARQLAAALADKLAAAALAGTLHLTRPKDYLLQFGPAQLTEVALLLLPPEPDGQADAVRSMATMLDENGIAFSLVAASRPDWLPGQAGRVDSWPGPAGAGIPPRGDHPAVVLLTEQVAEPDLPPVSVVLRETVWGSLPTALRADGRLHIEVEDWATISARGWPTSESIAVMIRPGDIATPMQRAALMRRLLAVVADGETRFLTLGTLADQLLAPDPLHERLWSTLHRQVTDPPSPAVLSLAERGRLLKDARVAWTFIDRFTDPTTGLCAGTVQDGQARRINREATYWDMASQMQGIVAAARMGIIQRDEASERLALMVDHLPTVSLDGHLLPPAVFETGGGGVVRQSFDICDTGRFLIALDLTVRSGLLPGTSAAALVESWDLAASIMEGRPHNHDGRAWHDTSMSHCTPYIAPVFGDLGLPLVSPYPAIAEDASADSKMALLSAVAAMGSYGTEPLLLQAIERGPTPESTFLADVLFDAQLDWFETTGQLKCVSEIPLNIAPWFTYQGLRVDRLGAEAWTILSSGDTPAFQTREFQQRIELLSAKSAYLWAAVHPHPHSSRLLNLMREKARIEGFGFSVGIYTASLEPMENYSDLNTNGVILAAIATMLHKDLPREADEVTN